MGKLAPALAIQPLNGKEPVSLTALSGKVAIVGFFATWCEPCKKSLTQLEELSKRSGGTVEVIGVSVDDTSRGVADFAKAQGVSFPIAWDEHHTLMWRWSVEKMPTTYILDAKGTVRFVHDTDKDNADLIARQVAELTNEVSVSNPKNEIASAPVPVSTAASPSAPPAATAMDVPPEAVEPSASSRNEAAPAPKPKAKPSSGKKGATKKTTKKSAAPATGV